jgi:hypothetical protein
MMNSDRFFGFPPSNLFIGQVAYLQFVMQISTKP